MFVRVSDTDHHNALIGSWYIKLKDNTYTSTAQLGEKRSVLQGTPLECTQHAIQNYIAYVGRRLRGYDQQLKELPTQEYPRQGFRPGWLPKLRNEILNRRSQFERTHKQRFYDFLVKLRSAGLPVGKIPPTPWRDNTWATNLDRAYYSGSLPEKSFQGIESTSLSQRVQNPATTDPSHINSPSGLITQTTPQEEEIPQNSNSQGIGTSSDPRCDHSTPTVQVLNDRKELVEEPSLSETVSPQTVTTKEFKTNCTRTFGVVVPVPAGTSQVEIGLFLRP